MKKEEEEVIDLKLSLHTRHFTKRKDKLVIKHQSSMFLFLKSDSVQPPTAHPMHHTIPYGIITLTTIAMVNYDKKLFLSSTDLIILSK